MPYLVSEDISVTHTEVLGAGNRGVVFKGEVKSSGGPIAIKVYRSDNRDVIGRNEQSLLAHLEHISRSETCANIVRLLGGFCGSCLNEGSRRFGKLHAIMEFCDAGSIGDMMAGSQWGAAPSNCLSYFLLHVLRGLEYLHGLGIVHRRVAPPNILLTIVGEIKLTDYFEMDGNEMLDQGIRPDIQNREKYLSPEACLGEGYTPKSDVWSVGLVLYELAIGRRIFADLLESFPALFEAICEAPEPRLDDSYPPRLREFLALCLTREVTAPSAPDSDRVVAAEALQEAATPCHVVVKNLSGDDMLGPLRFDSPVDAGELARMILEEGRVSALSVERMKLLTGTRELHASERVCGGTPEAPLVLTVLQLHCNVRADVNELLRHPFLASEVGTQTEFADWLAMLS